MYDFTKNWIVALSAAIFLFGSVFAQDLSVQEKERIDQAAYDLEMQDYQPVVADRSNDRLHFFIGDGTDEGPYPTYYGSWANYFRNVRTQILYLASEIKKPGLAVEKIKAIAWELNRVPEDPLRRYFKNVSIKMLPVTLTELEDNGTFVDMTDAVEVFAADSLTGPSETGWFEFDIDDFEYDGSANLIIDISYGDNGYWVRDYFRTNKTISDVNRYKIQYFDVNPNNNVTTVSCFDNLRLDLDAYYVAPHFEMTPETYTFQPVGFFNGAPFGAQEEAVFRVINAGIGTLNIVAAPSFFSEDADSFEVVTTETFPRPINGPSNETGDVFEFKVKFNPTGEGEKHTLLVVQDDFGKVVRTFPIYGFAYNIPEGDIIENPIVINQNWPVEMDYTATGSFAEFNNDYDITPELNDVVYKFTVTQDSYVSFFNVNGIDDIAVFAEGDSIQEDNNIYEDGQTEIGIGTFYAIVSGEDRYNFTMHVEGRDPLFEITPDSLGLGEVPIGAWHYGGKFVLRNAGGQSITINNVLVSDENGVFEVDGHYTFPYELTTQEMVFYVRCTANTVGTFEGALIVDEAGATTHVYPITATTYVPQQGDVAEMPFEITIDGDLSHSASLANPPMRKNYLEITPENEDKTDVVYHFTLTEDKVMNITVDGTDLDQNMRIYNAANLKVINPTEGTPVLEGASFTNVNIWKGSYYLILSGNQADYTINFTESTLPAPEAVTLIAPENGTQNAPMAPVLKWQHDPMYTQSIDVYMDTQYPPTNKVITDGDPSLDSLQLDNLEPANVYFWKVVAKNGNASTSSEIWGFTTMLPPPLFPSGEIVDFDNVHLQWVEPYANELVYFEGFDDEELPEGWSQSTNGTGTSSGWMFGSNLSSSYFEIPSHGSYAAANDDAGGNTNDGSEDYLITPSYNFSIAQSANLKFDSYYSGKYGHKAYVKISVNQGPWQMVQAMTANEEEWVNVEIDLSTYVTDANTDVRILFHSDDDGGYASGWAIDNVKVVLGLENEYASKALKGYNVYQDGVKINEETIPVTYYDVYNLTAGTYVFGVSALYNEGESEIVLIDPITILGRGIVSGNVIDADTDGGIASATLKFTANNMDDQVYTTVTDAQGHYSIVLPVIEGGFTVKATAPEYQPVVKQVIVVANQDITLNFLMGDIPGAITTVVAEEMSDQTVKVYWQLGGGMGDEFFEDFENGLPSDWTLVDADGDGNNWELKSGNYTPHSGDCLMSSASYINDKKGPLNPDNYLITPQVRIGGTSVLKFWIKAQDGNWPGDKVFIKVSTTDTDPDSFETVAVFTAPSEYEQKEVILEDYVGQEVYIAFNHADCTDFFWVNIDDVELTNATRVAPAATTYHGQNVAASIPFKTAGMNQAQIDKKMALYNAAQELRANQTKEFKSFSIYRGMYNNVTEEVPANWELLASNITDTVYMDNTWGIAAQGTYKYAVKAVYTVTESALGISNMVAKDMLSDVIIVVQVNTDDTPEGAQVKLKALDDSGIEYAGTVGADGYARFTEVWKGDYRVTVMKEGFMTEIFETTFAYPTEHRTVELKEALCKPTNLEASVECRDVTITWDVENCAGGSVEGEDITEGFEGNFPPDGWEVIVNNTAHHWEQVETITFDTGPVTPHEGTKQLYVYWDFADQDEWVITPQFNCGSSTVLTFWTYVKYGSDHGDHYYVKVSTDGGNTWTVKWDASTESGTQNHYDEAVTVDLSEFAGENIKVAWQAYAVGGIWSAWFIDDVTIASRDEVLSFDGTNLTRQPARVGHVKEAEGNFTRDNSVQATPHMQDRTLQGFKVYRDGSLLHTGLITENTYTSPNLPSGTYTYRVKAVYETGESVMSDPIEVTVEEMEPIEGLEAEKLGNNVIRVFWQGDGPGPGPGPEVTHVLQYDNGVNDNAIGLTNGGSFNVAAKFPTSMIADYNGMELRDISFYVHHSATFKLKVWKGDGNNPTLIYEQPVASVVANQWNQVDLTTPVEIDGTQALWIGYETTHSPGSYPAGIDAGPAVANAGKLQMGTDPWTDLSAVGFSNNWNLAGTVVGNRGEQAVIVNHQVIEDVLPVNPAPVQLALSGEAGTGLSFTEQFGKQLRDLTGYKLYRKNLNDADPQFELIAGDISASETQYFDELSIGGRFVYHMVTVYNNACESEPSNETDPITIIANNDLETGMKVYPNPASEILNIEVNANVTHVRVINQLNQVVFNSSRLTSDRLTIDVSNFSNGTYIIQFINNDRSVSNQRFVVTK